MNPIRVAFYAPLKAPDHAEPSGDRTVARLLLQALKRAGMEVHVASRLRARVGAGDAVAQRRLAQKGHVLADRLIAKYRKWPKRQRPQIWFTYHLYYKAVDWIGPRVAAALDIPYVVAEASHAPKRASGPYAFSHAAAEAAVKQAAAILCLNPADKECLATIVPGKRLIDLPPFLDMRRFAGERPDRALGRLKLATHYHLDPNLPWLLTVAMMRPGDKLASYEALAEALRHVRRPYQLILVGDGAARASVEHTFQPLKGRIAWLGRQPEAALPEIYAAADLFVWPAINEAFGMVLLEAQACGCPVIAGASGGVPAIVVDGETGWLSPPGDTAALAADIDFALDRDLGPQRLAARAHAFAEHDIETAAARLRSLLGKLAGP